MRDISTIIIHCAATPNGLERWKIEDIDEWHHQRGFRRTATAIEKARPNLRSVGYHAVIHTDGSVHWGRLPGEIGAHASGYNSKSLGVCLIGTDKFTPAQWAGLRFVVEGWCEEHKINKVIGHRDVSSKNCPGFDVSIWLRNFNPEEEHVFFAEDD